MRGRRLKERLDAGEVAYGIVVSWPDSDMVEAAGECGFDLAFVDAEHAALDIRTCADLVRAANVSGMSVLIRVPYMDVRGLYNYLDTGADGLIFPHITSAAAARVATAASLFPPLGSRGAMSSSRAARYGTAYAPADYFQAANESVWAIPMIEDVEAVKACEEILTTPGVRAIFVGPGDLALSRMGAKSENLPTVEAMVDQVIAASIRLGKVVATVAPSPKAAAAMVAKGVRILVTGGSGLFTTACREYLQAVPRKPAAATSR